MLDFRCSGESSGVRLAQGGVQRRSLRHPPLATCGRGLEVTQSALRGGSRGRARRHASARADGAYLRITQPTPAGVGPTALCHWENGARTIYHPSR